MKLIKLMTCAALAVACMAGISGCGSSGDYSKPKVAEGTILALTPQEEAAS